MEALDKAVMFLCLIILSCNIPALKGTQSNRSLKRSVRNNNSVYEDNASKSKIPTSLPTPSDSNAPCSSNKHEEFCKCRKQGLVEYEKDEYIMQNGTVFVMSLNATFSHLFYEMYGDFLRICKPNHMKSESNKKSNMQHYIANVYITKIGLNISIVCLTLHLIAFVLVPDLRNIPGYCMACLCVSLLSGYISFLFGFNIYIRNSYGLCVATAFSIHFFLLSSLLWMNVMAFDVLKSLLNATAKFRVISSRITFKNLYMYCVYAWGIALGFAIAAVASDNSLNFPEQYKPQFGQGTCWFQQGKALLVFFAAPVFTLICMNVVFFSMSVYVLISHSMKPNDTQRSMLKKNLVMYSRLAVIMGLSWVSGLLAGLFNEVALWYMFAILNTFQGFFIFLAFTLTPKVKKHVMKMFGLDRKKCSVKPCSNEKSFENVTKDDNDTRTTENV